MRCEERMGQVSCVAVTMKQHAHAKTTCNEFSCCSWKQPQMNEFSRHDSWQTIAILDHFFDLSHLHLVIEPSLPQSLGFFHLEPEWYIILSFQPVFFHLRPERYFTCHLEPRGVTLWLKHCHFDLQRSWLWPTLAHRSLISCHALK